MIFASRNVYDFYGVCDAGLEVLGKEHILNHRSLCKCAIEIEKVIGWIVDLMLNKSLNWESFFAVTNLYVVGSFDSNSITVLVLFSQWLTDSLVVVTWCFTILHKFDGTRCDGCATLSSIVHDSHPSLRLGVLDGNGRVNWVVIVGNCLSGGEIKCWPVVLNSLLHLESIWVCVESPILIEVGNMEVGNNLIAIKFLLERQRVEININFY